MSEVTYEGYGPGGVAVIVEALTDNILRTRPEISKIFDQGGGKIGASGAVMWMFKRRGVIAVKTSAVAEDKLMDVALGAGADDMTTAGEFYEILTPPDSFDAVRKALDAAKIPTEVAELKFLAENETDVDVEMGQRVLALLEKLDDHDDVNGVHSSLNMTDELEAAMKDE
jgi:YebC/PmpR family DNA-binding regulatory protein